MDNILVKYVLGESSEQEEQMVRSWIAESAENHKYYEQVRTIWAESKKVELSSTIDENTAWQRFQNFVEKRESGPAAEKPDSERAATRSLFRRVAIAACLLITMGIAAYFYVHRDVQIASGQQVLTRTLPDQSVVTLNKNSRLTYKNSFNKKDREVVLTGEAFFKVTPDKHRPFMIETGNIRVTVVGTSFNINNTRSGTEVIVETGVVTVQLKDKIIKLTPHQKVFVSRHADELVVQSNRDELYNYYRTDQFICKNTPLAQLVEALNRNYNANIKIINPDIDDVQLTTRFSKESLEDILNIISATLHVRIEHHKNGDITIQ